MSSDPTIDTNCMTVERFILHEQKKSPRACGDLTHLLSSIVTATKAISSAVRRAGMTNLFGVAGHENTTGDQVKKLDVLSNELFINMLKSSYTICAMVSEENENVVTVETENAGRYIAYFDPLDGSSNIDCCVSIGSIFGIARLPDSCNGAVTEKDVLVRGRELVAAGYALFGSATMLVLTTGHGVNGFTYDPSIGEFLLTDPDMKIRDKGKYYSVNEGYSMQFRKPVQDYLANLKDPNTNGGTYGARYIGSMVGDIHRTIKYGGVYMYPGTASSPDGKIRLMYECSPMALLVEQAGGIAVDGKGNRILDIVPKTIHDKCPIFMGSKKDVQVFLDILKK